MYQKFKEYEALQKGILKEILSELGAESLESVDEDELWEFDQHLKSGWNITPHGEHLSCLINATIRVEIPLYVSGCVGIDAGHFVEYLVSNNINGYDYQLITKELESLGINEKATKINPELTSDVWKLN